jgi:transcriptional regulator with XRE-family HTH domain
LTSDRAIAELLDISPSQVTRWRNGQIPDLENADRLAGLALVVEMLLRWLEPVSIEGWLHGINLHLANRTPAYLLRRGKATEVINAIEAEKAGAFG